MSKQLEGDDLRAETASYYFPARSPRLHHLFYPQFAAVSLFDFVALLPQKYV